MTTISEVCGGGEAGQPLVPGTLRGYRTWRLLGRRAADDPSMPGSLPLTSVTRRDVRWDQVLTARCVPGEPAIAGPSAAITGSATDGDHRAPHPGCVCGIYAWYDPNDTYMTRARVFGVVESSGVVLMGERGFRAQRARIAAVVTRNRRAAAACERAGVTVYRRRRDLVRDYPPEDPSSLLGEPRPPEPTTAMATTLMPGLRGFDILAFLAVWARVGLIAAVFVALPPAPALVAATAAHFATTGLLLARLRH